MCCKMSCALSGPRENEVPLWEMSSILSRLSWAGHHTERWCYSIISKNNLKFVSQLSGNGLELATYVSSTSLVAYRQNRICSLFWRLEVQTQSVRKVGSFHGMCPRSLSFASGSLLAISGIPWLVYASSHISVSLFTEVSSLCVFISMSKSPLL